MTSPSTRPVVKVLLSQIALMVDTLNDCRSMGTAETVPTPGEDTYVVASSIPRSNPMKSIVIVWMMCAMNIWSVKIKHSRESVALYS
jgi:hypothetical protein